MRRSALGSILTLLGNWGAQLKKHREDQTFKFSKSPMGMAVGYDQALEKNHTEYW